MEFYISVYKNGFREQLDSYEASIVPNVNDYLHMGFKSYKIIERHFYVESNNKNNVDIFVIESNENFEA
jgi:hypothetical protein